MASLIVSVLSELSNYRKGMAEVQRTANQTAGKIGNVGKVVGGALLTGAVVKFGRDSVRAFDEAQKAQAKLATALANSPATIGVTTDAFAKFNKELAKHTLADDDALAAGEGVLANFGLTEAQLKQMIPVIADVAATMGTDIPSAADTVGKALLGNARALKSLGIAFKPTGDSAADLARIQELLAEKTKGAAQAQLDAAGPGARLQKSLHELEETIGSVLVPVLEKASGALSGLFDWFTNLPAPVKQGAAILGGVAAGVWLVVAAERAWTAVQTALDAALDANPIGLIVIGIAALVAGLVVAWQHSETFRKVIVAALQAVANAAGDAIGWILDGVSKFLGAVATVADAATHLPKIGKQFEGVADKVRGAQQTTAGWADAMHHGLDLSGLALKGVADDSDKAAGAQGNLGGAMGDTTQQALTQAQQIDKLSGVISGVIDAQAAYDESLRRVDAAKRAVSDANKAITDATDAHKQAMKDATAASDDLAKAQKTLTDALKPATVLEMATAVDNLKVAQNGLKDAQKSLADATTDYHKILTAFQTGKSLDPASFDELAIAQDDVRTSFQDWQKALATGKSIGDVARAHKQYTDSVKALDDLQKRGKVTEDDVRVAREKVDTATADVDSSTKSAADAETDLTNAKNKGLEVDPAVVTARKGVADATDALTAANKRATDTQTAITNARRDLADRTKDVDTAQRNAVKSADDLRKKTEDEKNTFKDLADQVGNVKGQLDQLGAAHPEIASFLSPLYAELGKALQNLPKGTVIGFTPLPPGIAGPPTPILKAAAGAVVMPRPGGTFVNVAEAGKAEAIVPLPAGMRSFDSGGGTVNNYVTVEGNVWSLRELTDALHEELLAKQRRSGSLGLK